MNSKATEGSRKETKLKAPRYWKSLDEYSETLLSKNLTENESRQAESGVNRRYFIKLIGAPFAFAGLALSSCSRSKKKKNKADEILEEHLRMHTPDSCAGCH